MTTRSSALPYAAVTALALLFGASNAVRQYLPVVLGVRGTTPAELSGYLLGASLVNALLVPVGAAVVGYAFADGLAVAARLAVTVAVTLLLAALGVLVGFGVTLTFVLDIEASAGSLVGQFLSAAVVGLTNGLTLTVAVVAGAAVRRLRARPASPEPTP
ncbi:hypothetical protein [Halorarius litoreus]|uniref:hypothetical protein n=1 Tax=Halorarius litoreus TaxID=2962676 RepID=UPI0020CCD771|nr:hypothetical protein [Halorarius litoreus]